MALSASGSSICGNSICSSTSSFEIPDKPLYASPYALRVFVSSSMPAALLKSYAREAKNYNATLVFKGLPNDSFNELSKLIISMKSEDTRDEELGSIQIDDEAFDRFNITSVPSVVLSDESECSEMSAHCKLIYDKVDGAIYIKSALEKFVSEGDTSEAATKILRQVDSEVIK